jgi:hypothetical protein
MKFAKVKANIDRNNFICSDFTVNGAPLLVRNFELTRDGRGDIELKLTIGHRGFDFNMKRAKRVGTKPRRKARK